MKIFEAQVTGEEKITLQIDHESKLIELSGIGSLALLKFLQEYKKYKNKVVTEIPLPSGQERHHLLFKEVLLKSQNLWKFPYEHDELCHCRRVQTRQVDEAIIMGAKTPEEVSRLTSASTACGTCRPHVEDIIKYRTS